MNWYGQQRHAWIAEMLQIYGFINRKHICAKFGCSAQLAGNDLTRFAGSNSDWVQYCPRRKAYISAATLSGASDDAPAGRRAPKGAPA